MRAFMIATGGYGGLAEWSAPAFEWSTGIAVEILKPDGEPYRSKLQHLPDDEQFIFVDADILFCRKWELPDVPDETFCAAPTTQRESHLTRIVDEYERAIGFRPDTSKWFNTGLFIASAAHRKLFDRATELFDMGHSHLHEETVLNIALQELGTPVEALTKVQNQCGYRPPEKAVHACYCYDVETKLAEMKRCLWWFGASDLKEFLADKGLRITEQPRAIPTTTHKIKPVPTAVRNRLVSKGLFRKH